MTKVQNKKTTLKGKSSSEKTPEKSLSHTPAPKQKTDPAARFDEETDAFIKEVTEEVKNDNLIVFWNKYGLVIILFVVFSVIAAVSFESIKKWREEQYQTQTEMYLRSVQSGENYENAILALEKIASENNGIYSELARIQIANILFEQGKNQDAQNMLQAIADNDELNPRVRNLAAFKLAASKMDTATTAEIEALLTPIAETDETWGPMAKDMLAMTAIRDGNLEKAREIYTQLLANGKLSDNFKNRVQDMLSAINDM